MDLVVSLSNQFSLILYGPTNILNCLKTFSLTEYNWCLIWGDKSWFTLTKVNSLQFQDTWDVLCLEAVEMYSKSKPGIKPAHIWHKSIIRCFYCTHSVPRHCDLFYDGDCYVAVGGGMGDRRIKFIPSYGDIYSMFVVDTTPVEMHIYLMFMWCTVFPRKHTEEEKFTKLPGYV